MLCIKLIKDNELIGVEKHIIPIYVYVHPRNKHILACPQPIADGILSLDKRNYYTLEGKNEIRGSIATAVIISEIEYYELLNKLNKIDTDEEEDNTPEVSDDEEYDRILTRSELTAKCTELEKELKNIKNFLGIE